MWSVASFIEDGVQIMLNELRSWRELQNGVRFTYFPLQVLIMKLTRPILLRNCAADSEQDLVINASSRTQASIGFERVGCKQPLDYVMFCCFDYENIPFPNSGSPQSWRRYSNLSMAFLIEGPIDGMGVNTGGVYWLHNEPQLAENFKRIMNHLGAAIVENLDMNRNLDQEAAQPYRNEPNCYLCGRPVPANKGHVHHNHRTGEIYGNTHPKCNANARKQNALPVFVHCPNADDFVGILMTLFPDHSLKITPDQNSPTKANKGRKLKARITLELNENLKLVFINSHSFLPDSWQNLETLIPRTCFERSNNPNTYFHKEPIPLTVQSTLLLADTIMFVRKRIQHKFELDLCWYHSLNEFVLDSILKLADITLTLPHESSQTINPIPETLEASLFQFSHLEDNSPVVRAMKSYLPYKDFKTVPKREIHKYDSTFISNLSNDNSTGYIFRIFVVSPPRQLEITIDPENDYYFVHYILLKYLITDSEFKYSITKIIEFKQTPFMEPFLSKCSDLTDSNEYFQIDEKLGQLLCKNIIENTNMVKPLRTSLKYVAVETAADFQGLMPKKKFVTAHTIADDLVEVVMSEKYKWYEFIYLSLTLRDLIFTYSRPYGGVASGEPAGADSEIRPPGANFYQRILQFCWRSILRTLSSPFKTSKRNDK